MAFPNNRVANAFTAARAIKNPLKPGYLKGNQKLGAQYGNDIAQNAMANKFGLGAFNADKSKLTALQRYRYNEMMKTNPNQARTYRQTLRGRYDAANPAAQTPAADTTAATTPATDAGNSATMQTLFPQDPNLAQYGDPSYLAKQWETFADPSKSSMYNWRVKAGTEDLNNFLASKGQLDSGAGIKAGGDMLARIGAEESNAAYQRALNAAQMAQSGAGQSANFNQTNADRLERMQAAEANRRMQQGNTAWDRQAWVIQQLLNQNPLSTAFGASQGQSDLYARLASALGAASGGGGGGGGTPFIPNYQFPAMDNSMANIYGINADLNASNSTSNILGGLINSLFGG